MSASFLSAAVQRDADVRRLHGSSYSSAEQWPCQSAGEQVFLTTELLTMILMRGDAQTMCRLAQTCSTSRDLLHDLIIEAFSSLPHFIARHSILATLFKIHPGNRKPDVLCAAAERSMVSVVRTLLKQHSAAVKAVRTMHDYSISTTPLFAASERGCRCGRTHAETVKLLLSAGADVHEGCCLTTTTKSALFDDYHTPPIFAACQGGFEAIVQELLLAGARPNAQADTRLAGHVATPSLFIACASGHVRVVKRLLHANADAACERYHETCYGGFVVTPALFIACQNLHLDVVNALLAAGADVHAPQRDHDANGYGYGAEWGCGCERETVGMTTSPLIVAIATASRLCWHDEEEALPVVRALLEARADPNAPQVNNYPDAILPTDDARAPPRQCRPIELAERNQLREISQALREAIDAREAEVVPGREEVAAAPEAVPARKEVAATPEAVPAREAREAAASLSAPRARNKAKMKPKMTRTEMAAQAIAKATGRAAE